MVLLIGMAVSALLVVLCLLVHYEALRLISALVPRLAWLRPRQRIVVVVSGTFVAHTVEVWLFAAAYWLVAMFPAVAAFSAVYPEMAAHFAGIDAPDGQLQGYMYFSIVTFTSLGLGDVVPHGVARMLAGVESIVGLLLIGWSATFTYLQMKELWPLHRGRAGHKGRRPAD